MGDSEYRSGQLKAQKRSGRERPESLQESAFLLLLLPLKTLRSSCPSGKRVSSATWLLLKRSLGFKRIGVNKE